MAKKIYKSFDQLNGNTLKSEDIVVLKSLNHSTLVKLAVMGAFMNFDNYNHSEENVALIFNCKTHEEARGLLGKAYAPLTVRGGTWPEVNVRDYEALTRAALMVFAINEKWPAIQFKQKDGKWGEVIELPIDNKVRKK